MNEIKTFYVYDANKDPIISFQQTMNKGQAQTYLMVS